MKKAMTPLWVGIVILGALLISATMQNNISSAISLSQQNTGQTTSLYFNINTATVDELASIPGLGEDLAKKIIAHRRQNGPYQSVQELLQIKGIGQRTFDKIAKHLTVGG